MVGCRSEERVSIMIDQFIGIIYLGFAVSAISVTLTKADIGEPLRDWFTKKFGPKSFLSCPFCTSYWVAFPLIVIYRPVVLRVFFVIDVLVSLAAVVGVAAIISGVTIQTIPNFKEKK